MAQLVSREHLLQLVKADGKVEESEGSFSYEDFCKYHAKCIEDGKRLDFRGQLDDGEDRFSFAYDKVNETYLASKCPPIKFAGQGSSRAAFALAGGKCLKIAVNAKGVGQNRQELKNASDGSYMCFTKNYANADDFASLLTECCAKATRDDFQRMLGISPYYFEYVLYLVVDNKGIDGALKHLNNGYSETSVEQTQNIIKLLNNVKKQKSLSQMAVISDLFRFYEKNGWNADVLLPGDLVSVQNWGLVARDGQLCLVVLDAGFSKDVAKMY